MASGSRSRGGRGSGGARGSSSRSRAAEAPSAGDAALLASQLNNPALEALPAAELVAHLAQYRRTDDFNDAALVFAAREREADRLIRENNERIHNARVAEARIRQATETEAALRAKIHSVQLSVAKMISAISGVGAGLTPPAAGPSHEPVLPHDFITASTGGVGCSLDNDATSVQQAMVAQGEVGGDDVPAVETRHNIRALWSRPAPHLVAALRMNQGTLSHTAPQQPAAAPLPANVLIDDDGKRATKQVAAQVLGSNEEAAAPQGDRELVSEDAVRARDTPDYRKVSEEVVTHGEDEAASLHRRLKGKQVARSTKKAHKHKGTSLQLGTAALILSSGITAHGLTQQGAGPSHEHVPQDIITAGIHGVGGSHKNDANSIQQSKITDDVAMITDNCEVSKDVLRGRDDTTTGRHKVSEEVVAKGEDVAASLHRRSKGKHVARATKKARSHKGTSLQLGAAALMSSDITRHGLTQQDVSPSHELVPQEVITAGTDGVGSHEDAIGVQQTIMITDDVPMIADDYEVSKDILRGRITPGRCNVSEEVAHGEDVAASLHGHSQGKQPAMATKKAPIHRPKWMQQLLQISSGISGHGQQAAAGHGHEPVPQNFVMASNDGVGSDDATGVQTMFVQGEVGDDMHMPMEMRHGALNCAAQHPIAGPLMSHGALSRSVPHVAAAPLRALLIDDDEREEKQDTTKGLISSNEEAQGNREGSEEDVLSRVTSSCRNVEAARGATKKACKNKVPSFYNQVLIKFKEGEELVKKAEEERLAKEAAAAASNQVHCRCWSSAPYMPSKSCSDVEEDPGDGSQN